MLEKLRVFVLRLISFPFVNLHKSESTWLDMEIII